MTWIVTLAGARRVKLAVVFGARVSASWGKKTFGVRVSALRAA